MEWAEIKKALNSTVGTENFKPLDKIFEEMLTKGHFLQERTAKKNGVYTADEQYDGIKKMTVALPWQEKKFTAPKQGTYVVTPDSEYAGISKLTVEQPRERLIRSFSSSQTGGYIDLDTGNWLQKNSLVINHGLGMTPHFFYGVCDYGSVSPTYAYCYFYTTGWGSSGWNTYVAVDREYYSTFSVSMDSSSVTLSSEAVDYLWRHTDLSEALTFNCVAIY